MPSPRSLLEGYINEFENTLHFVRSKLDGRIGLPLSGNHKFVELFAIQIPNETPERDLWVQLVQLTLEVQKLMCLTTSFLDTYGVKMREYGQQLQGEYTIPKTYGRLVECYGIQISLYATAAIGCGCRSVPKTDERRKVFKKRRDAVKCDRDKLKEFGDKVLQAKATLEQQHHQNTSIVLLLQQQPMTLPIPHEEILDAGLDVIDKFQNLISQAGFY